MFCISSWQELKCDQKSTCTFMYLNISSPKDFLYIKLPILKNTLKLKYLQRYLIIQAIYFYLLSQDSRNNPMSCWWNYLVYVYLPGGGGGVVTANSPSSGPTLNFSGADNLKGLCSCMGSQLLQGSGFPITNIRNVLILVIAYFPDSNKCAFTDYIVLTITV